MNAPLKFILAIAVLLGGWVYDATSSNADEPDEEAYFEQHVRPLLVERCYACHSGVKTEGGLALDTREGWQRGGDSGPALIPGDPENSLLIEAVHYRSLEMPPAEAGGKLADAQIAVLTHWIRSGAADPRGATARLGGMNAAQAESWWAFQPLPAVTNLTPAAIDRLITAQHAAHSLKPSAPADRRTLLRRASYDLTGLPPTAEEVERFVEDESEEAFAKVVDRLLESPQYGAKWGRHWLDVVRYADTAGENTDRPLPHAWRYRNWVIDAFQRDLPFDQFVRLQLAGDLLAHGSLDADSPEQRAAAREGIIATGYLAIARRFGHDIDKDIHLMYEDVIGNVGMNFLGLSVGCARCHDHKYDPVTAEDYYAMYGIFSSTRFAFPGCEPQGQPRDLVPLLSEAEIAEQNRLWQQRSQHATAASDALRGRIEQFAAQSTHVIAEANIAEGATVALNESLTDTASEGPRPIAMRKGEVLELIVSPNASHGADTTLVQWEITETQGQQRTWSTADVVQDLLHGNPYPGNGPSSWCFIETAQGPAFLTDKNDQVGGKAELHAWSNGETPSVLVNRSDAPVDVWTSLPAQSLFVHPGIDRPVAVAWVCPDDMHVTLAGHIADAHPAGGDGVAFRLVHIRAPEIGPDLVQLGELLQTAAAQREPMPVVPVAYAVAEATAQDAAFQRRGNPEEAGDPVPRRWLTVFGGERVPGDAGSGRQQLGDWIASHPLTARVMVNRIWHWHFGRGLVASPNDFGSRGESPSHPQLLDLLAAEFRHSGYSVKAMHRLIMATQAYQRSASADPAVRQQDADNRLLTHFTLRRLSAEELRDSLLLVAGNLDTTAAQAHPFPAESTWTFTQHTPFSAEYDTNRRSVYLMVQRQRRHPYLALFDGADPNASTAVRQKTTAPTQALYFLNAPFFHQQASDFAARLSELPTASQRVERAYRLLFQRSPSAAEQQHCTDFLASYPGGEDEKWAAYARVLLASNEFLHVE